MRRVCLALIWTWGSLLGACGDEARRPCVERAECFAGEYCSDNGVCAPYKGKRKTKAQPDNVGVPIAPRDMGQDMQGD